MGRVYGTIRRCRRHRAAVGCEASRDDCVVELMPTDDPVWVWMDDPAAAVVQQPAGYNLVRAVVDEWPRSGDGPPWDGPLLPPMALRHAELEELHARMMRQEG